MEELFRQKLRRIHRANRVLWAAILSGVIVLGAVGLVFAYFNLIDPVVSANRAPMANITLIIVVGLLFLVLYLKRTYLVPEKMIERARHRDLNIEGDIADLVNEFGDNTRILAKTLIIMRRYFMVIWSIANVIALIGFIEFILTGNRNDLFVYLIVSLYTLAINFPAFGIVERCHAIIQNN